MSVPPHAGMTAAEYTNWLASVKVGDDIPFWASYGAKVYTRKVDAVTPKRIRIGTAEYDRLTGQERGGYDSLTPLTDEIRRQIEKQAARSSAIKVIERFSPVAWAGVPTDKLTFIAGLLERKVWP